MDHYNQLVTTRLGTMVVNRNDRYIGRSLIEYGEFSVAEADLLQQLINQGDYIVEAGANIGAHTLLFSYRVGETGQVWAFEPQRLVFQTLCANLALNSCQNVVAREQGLGEAAEIWMAPTPDPHRVNNFGGLALHPNAAIGEPVQITTIDALELPRCQLIKADVEGMELAVLRGATATLERCRPILYLENDRQHQSAALLEQLLAWRYRIWWHLAPLFNPNNFRGHSVNLFTGIVSVNLLCQPAERAKPVAGLQEIHHPDAWWQPLANPPIEPIDG